MGLLRPPIEQTAILFECSTSGRASGSTAAPVKSGTGRHRIALFDVDGTLLKGSSGYEATLFLFNRRMLGPRHVAAALWYAALHGLGLSTYEQMYSVGLRVFEGMSVDGLIALSQTCLETRVVARLYVGALQEIAAQKALKREVVLVSAGPRYLIEAVAQVVGADACITAGPEVRDGRVTDVLDGCVCSGIGKVKRVKNYLHPRGLRLNDCLYFADSINDLPLLCAVGEPVVVNPDPRLWAEASRRRWRQMHFGQVIGATPLCPPADRSSHAVNPSAGTAGAL